MTVSVSKTLLFTSGQIKFSDLRQNFKETSSGPISASELRRNTSTNITNPIVPDATENTAISTNNNLKTSQFRNTIKYYDLNQTGTDLNLNIFAQTWNSNLSKNIVKKINVNGTCASNTTSLSALYLNAVVYNLNVIINGFVYGAGGTGGTISAGNDGGSAISLISLGGLINVLTTSGSQVYGGGGGGAKGATGVTGPTGTCSYVSSYTTGQQCGGCPGCNPGYTQSCYPVGRCGRKNSSTNYQSNCFTTVYYTSTPPIGGDGGNGGNGVGYNQAASLGSAGSLGSLSSCSPNTTVLQTQGATGETGGDGGDWGSNGNSTALATGGLPGASVTGLNYRIDPDSITDSFRGPR